MVAFLALFKRHIPIPPPPAVPVWDRNAEYLHVLGVLPPDLPDPQGYGYIAVSLERRPEIWTKFWLEQYRKEPPASPQGLQRPQRVSKMPAAAPYSRKEMRTSLPSPSNNGQMADTTLRLVNNGDTDSPRGGPKRQDFSNEKVSRRDTKLGDYILGQTLGEGEFGKVKMGWKKEGGHQVAIKLIRREKLDNQSRLQKVYREISILRDLNHPNIVRLHEMVETERTIGIILEYASGGELFDYILHERYLKDNSARRLFAQLVSGVGYLHKRGIIHRDLKLENLLLDRNHNIIITDFGFANTFDPTDELGEKVESKLHRRSFVKRHDLEKVQSNGFRRGDLMATSCGSPCYAAPELVVSDGLYTGRKVDVWSCGVILYAMLAGYLPFDDDPANPDGDNINLLYKYIVTAPLVFPEHVTPHARDLLRRILVPDPRQRADLFEVARHSWLSDYAHVVEFITSGTTVPIDGTKATVNTDGQYGLPPLLARSASVREATKPHAAPSPVGGLMTKHGKANISPESEKPKTPRETKRRTVQIEYVAPQSQTTRGETRDAATDSPKTKAKRDGPSPVTITRKPAPAAATMKSMPPPSRPGREVPRSISDSTAFTMSPPTTGSYGLPSAATVATTNAEGRFSQPPSSRTNRASTAALPSAADPVTRSESIQRSVPQVEHKADALDPVTAPEQAQRSHKRNSTLSNFGERLFGRSNSKSTRRAEEKPNTPERTGNEALWEPGYGKPYAFTQEEVDAAKRAKSDRRSRMHPPSSHKPIASPESAPRKSTDSRRSFGFSRKSLDLDTNTKRSSRRFSFIPRLGSSSGKEQQTREQYVDGPAALEPEPSDFDNLHPIPRYEPRDRVIGRDLTQMAPAEPIQNRLHSGDYTTKPFPDRTVSGVLSEYGGAASTVAGSRATSAGDHIPFDTPWPIYTAEQEAAVDYSRQRGQVTAMPKPTEEDKRREAEWARKNAAVRRKMDEEERKRQDKERKRQSRVLAADDLKKDFSKDARPSTASKVMGFFRRKHDKSAA